MDLQKVLKRMQTRGIIRKRTSHKNHKELTFRGRYMGNLINLDHDQHFAVAERTPIDLRLLVPTYADARVKMNHVVSHSKASERIRAARNVLNVMTTDWERSGFRLRCLVHLPGGGELITVYVLGKS